MEEQLASSARKPLDSCVIAFGFLYMHAFNGGWRFLVIGGAICKLKSYRFDSSIVTVCGVPTN